MSIPLTAEQRFRLADHPQSDGNYIGLWILGALPVFLLAFSNKWIFTPAGFIDPWVYFGYYQNLPRHLTIFDGTYYGTRLSALLPGYAAYSCLPPLAANYVLHLGLYYACIGSLYLILARTVSPRAGLLAAVCLGCQFSFLRAVGWDYVDGFGIAYFFLSVLALTTAAHAISWKRSLVAAGLGSAAFVIANLFYVVYLPYFVIHYVYLNRQKRQNPLLVSLGLYLLGAIGLTFAICLYSGWVGGRFWFLGPSVQFARNSLGRANPWKAPIATWLPGAVWLVLPALTALGSLFFFHFRSRLRDQCTALLYQLQFLFTLAIMIGWEWRGEPVLQCPSYASLLLPATLLALGAQLAPHVERLSPRQFTVLVTMVLLVLLAPYSLNEFGDWLARLNQWSGALTLAAGTLGLALLASRRPGALSAAGIISLSVSIPSYVAWHTFDCSKLPGTELFQKCSPVRREYYQGSDVLRSVFEADKVLEKWDPSGQVRFWYHSRAPMGKVYTSVCSTYLWGYRLVNFDFPSVVDSESFGRLNGQRVLILSADREALVKANVAMEELGLEALLVAEHRIEYPSVAFTMSYVAIGAKGLSEQPLRAGFEQGTEKGALTVTPPDEQPSLPLGKWHACYDPPRMTLRKTAEGLEVTTPPDRWAYALLYSPLSILEEGIYRFELKYSLRNGDIAFGALTEDQSRWIGQAGPGLASPTPDQSGLLVKSFSLRLKAGETFRLLLTNNHPSGNHPSQFKVQGVRGFRETSTSPAATRAVRPISKRYSGVRE
jgi:hypothetical protein